MFEGFLGSAPSSGSSSVTIGTAIGSGTSGSILYIDSSVNLAQDNTNLFYDATNHVVTTSAGAAAHPSYNFVGATTSGTYSPGANAFSIAANGVEAIRVNSSQQVGISSTTFGTVAMLQVNANNTTDNAATVQLNASATGNKGLVVQAFASATASLLELQNSSGTSVFTVGPPALPGNSTTVNFLNITNTMPASASTTSAGINFSITAGATNTVEQDAMRVFHLAGNTTSSFMDAIYGSQRNSGAGTSVILGNANYGIYGDSIGIGTGTNVAIAGSATGGIINISGNFQSTTNKASGTNIGVLGLALNTAASPTEVGGYFGLSGSAPTFASAALIADNGSEANPVFLGRVNGTTAFTVGPSGAYYGTIDNAGVKASALTLDVTKGNVHTLTSTPSTNMTITPSAAGVAGQHLWIIINSDATGGDVITFASTFKSSGTMTLTASKAHTIHFISDSTNWYEVARTLAL